jgi:hypothetical protein
MSRPMMGIKPCFARALTTQSEREREIEGEGGLAGQ